MQCGLRQCCTVGVRNTVVAGLFGQNPLHHFHVASTMLRGSRQLVADLLQTLIGSDTANYLLRSFVRRVTVIMVPNVIAV